MALTIGVPKETAAGEKRVATVPEVVEKLAKLGFTVAVQSGAGAAVFAPCGVWQKTQISPLSVLPPIPESARSCGEPSIPWESAGPGNATRTMPATTKPWRSRRYIAQSPKGRAWNRLPSRPVGMRGRTLLLRLLRRDRFGLFAPE